ncbi:MAG: DNA repair protein RecN [Anaerorhabdus sp.]
MLKSLYIKNFILIEEISLNFESGFSAFTGETGAGKSILIDAIGLLTSDRASTSMIKKGADFAIIEGIFDLSNEAREMLESEGFDCKDDVVVSREIRDDGKNIVKINYRNVTLSLLKSCLKKEIDIHSQHDSQYLLNKSNHLSLLDRFIDSNDLFLSCSKAYEEYINAKKSLEKVKNEELRQDDLEYYTYQLNEIDNANLSIDEDIMLTQKEKQFHSYNKNNEKYNQIISLYDDNVDVNLYEIKKILENMGSTEIEEKLLEKVNTFYYELSDSFDDFKNYISSLDNEDIDIDKIQERLFEIQKLKRKYGPSIEQIFEKRDEFISKIDIFSNRQEIIDDLEKNLLIKEKNYLEIAQKLHKIRTAKINELDSSIIGNLKELELPNAVFKTNITKSKTYTASGIDDVEFLISMNVGEDLKSLSKVASGGELSRLMLGLKIIFTKLQGIQTVIFDEIDTGVSGSTATAIGIKMHQLSLYTQVFSVTHLAQVAACAKHHYHVHKSQRDNITDTKVSKLNEQERINNLSIISSGSLTEASLNAARELFNSNQNKTKNV